MSRNRYKLGFTLIEILIGVSIVGLLAAMAVPMVSRARVTTQTNTCLENQRILYEAVSLYELEQRTTLNSIAGNGVAIRDAIVTAGYIVKSNAFDCPASATLDFDDYRLSYEGTSLTHNLLDPTIRPRHTLIGAESDDRRGIAWRYPAW